MPFLCRNVVHIYTDGILNLWFGIKCLSANRRKVWQKESTFGLWDVKKRNVPLPAEAHS